jgi:hypothetical protein
MLSDVQRARVRFHLGYPNDQISGPSLEVQQNLLLDRLAPMTELGLIGDPTDQTEEFQGLPLCAPGSQLDRLEQAWGNLGPATIDDSLFVQSAGSVSLRRDELQARRSLYREQQEHLATLLDVKLFGYSAQIQGPHDCY